jgi:hypothetical protein
VNARDVDPPARAIKALRRRSRPDFCTRPTVRNSSGPLSQQGLARHAVACVEQQAAAIEAAQQERGLQAAAFGEEHGHLIEEQCVPQNGARVVVKAWTDPALRARLLAPTVAGVSASLTSRCCRATAIPWRWTPRTQPGHAVCRIGRHDPRSTAAITLHIAPVIYLALDRFSGRGPVTTPEAAPNAPAQLAET